MVIYMAKLKEQKRGPKYPPGVGKRKVLLIALNHPDGVGEGKLIDEIKEKLSFSNKANRVIKGHLDDLGPGRTVKGKWEEGEQLLIKIPSKYEPKDTKKRLLDTLKVRGVEVDVNDLPEESFWKPVDPQVKILRYFLDPTDFSFVNTKYGQRAIINFFLPLFGMQCGLIKGYLDENGELVCLTELERKEPEKRTLKIKGIPIEKTLEEGVILPELEPDIWSFLKSGFKLSSTALYHTLYDLPEVKIAAALMLSAKPNYVDRGLDTRSIAIATLCSCLLIDMAKYPLSKDKIGAFFRDHDIAHTLTTWLDWDFLHQRIEEWIARMYHIGEVFRQ